MEIILRTLLKIWIFFWLLFWLSYLFFWLLFKPKVYSTIWKYDILFIPWFQDSSSYHICYKKEKNTNRNCISWEILWLKEIWDSDYIYYKSYYITSKEQKLFWIKWNPIEWINYVILTGNEITFFQKDELKDLSEEEWLIFEWLELTPTITISWNKHE
jgi:hypothetical protein